ASLKATTQLGEVDIEDAEGIKDGTEVVANLLVTTPGVLRSLQVGDLDRDQVAAPFSKYVLYAKKFDDPDEDGDEKRGAHVDLVWGVDDSTNLHGFVSRTGVAQHLYGAHASYRMSEAFNLAFAGVREVAWRAATDDPDFDDYQDEKVFSIESKGVLESLDYSALYATQVYPSGDTA